MCFSATASFVAGGILAPAGVYCIAEGLRKRPRTLPIAVVPAVFSIQQFCEGFVWLGLERNDPGMTRAASLAFLFFALVFWPFWFSFSFAITDPRPRHSKLFGTLALASTTFFWLYFYPLLEGPASLLRTSIAHHSIHYYFFDLEVYQYLPATLMRSFYFLCVAIPLAMGPTTVGRFPGILFGASVLVAVIMFNHAFVSVWCFIAAWLSVLFCRYFYYLEKDERVATAMAH